MNHYVKGNTMKDYPEANFSISNLPKVSVYCLDNNYFMQFYEMNEICLCGSQEWIMSFLKISTTENDLQFLPKRIHRCKSCNQIRLSKLKNEVLVLIDKSKEMEDLMKEFKSKDLYIEVISNILEKLMKRRNEKSELVSSFTENKYKKENNLSPMCSSDNVTTRFSGSKMNIPCV